MFWGNWSGSAESAAGVSSADIALVAARPEVTPVEAERDFGLSSGGGSSSAAEPTAEQAPTMPTPTKDGISGSPAAGATPYVGVREDPWEGLGLPVDTVRSGAPGYSVRLSVTHYWPPLGGTNCWIYEDGYCRSRTASGVPWELVRGVAAACPMEWPNGSSFVIGDMAFLCLDRGSMRCVGDICQVDILTDQAVDGEYAGTLFLP